MASSAQSIVVMVKIVPTSSGGVHVRLVNVVRMLVHVMPPRGNVILIYVVHVGHVLIHQMHPPSINDVVMILLV
jgi:hypothetical protein